MIIKESWPAVRFFPQRNKWIVDGRPIFKREYKETQSEANTRRAEMRVEATNAGARQISHAAQLELNVCQDLLKPHGYSFLEAIQEFVKIKEEEAKGNHFPTVSEAVDKWLEVKQTQVDQGRRSNKTLKEIRAMKKLFDEKWGTRKVNEVSSSQISTWLESLKKADGSPITDRTRLNIRTKLSQLFNFCKLHHNLKINPCDIVTVEAPDAEVVILSIDECKKLIALAKASEFERNATPYVLLSLFIGLRPGEADQIKWEDIQDNQVFVRADISKSRESRCIPVSNEIWDELKKHRSKGVIVGTDWRRKWDSIKISAGYRIGKPAKGIKEDKRPGWHPDCLRHTFASNWLAMSAAGEKGFEGGRPRLAELMSNSAPVIKKKYRKTIPNWQAKEFWTLISKYQKGTQAAKGAAVSQAG